MVGINGFNSVYNQYDVNKLKKNKPAEKVDSAQVKRQRQRKLRVQKTIFLTRERNI